MPKYGSIAELESLLSPEEGVIEMALLAVYEMPEVTLAAQIEALCEDKAKIDADIAKLEQYVEAPCKQEGEMDQLNSVGSVVAEHMTTIKTRLKHAILNDKDVSKLRARLGEKFNEGVEAICMKALKDSSNYQTKLSELKALRKNAEKLQAEWDAEVAAKAKARKSLKVLRGKSTRLANQIANLELTEGGK